MLCKQKIGGGGCGEKGNDRNAVALVANLWSSLDIYIIHVAEGAAITEIMDISHRPGYI
jgi:hypothetical protein